MRKLGIILALVLSFQSVMAQTMGCVKAQFRDPFWVDTT